MIQYDKYLKAHHDKTTNDKPTQEARATETTNRDKHAVIVRFVLVTVCFCELPVLRAARVCYEKNRQCCDRLRVVPRACRKPSSRVSAASLPGYEPSILRAVIAASRLRDQCACLPAMGRVYCDPFSAGASTVQAARTVVALTVRSTDATRMVRAMIAARSPVL